MQPGCRARELVTKLRAGRTLKNASGMTLDPLKGGGARRHRSSSLAVRGNAPFQRSRFIRVS
jgi:hypothetical protein